MLDEDFFSQRVYPTLLKEIFQTPFSINNKQKRKEKPISRWHARNTHVTQTSNRIFERMVPVDYTYQSKQQQKYQEPFLLLVQ